jgi:hypothetical protein
MYWKCAHAWASLRLRKKVVARCIIAGMVVAATINVMTPTVYEASVKVHAAKDSPWSYVSAVPLGTSLGLKLLTYLYESLVDIGFSDPKLRERLPELLEKE